ncbi:ATPase [Corynebacterium phocae]|uniref:ATPase n=1 Tax=Corynebacterium phocae TaxID=161895 RepID=A0A1L7D2K7_9CORY|nr:YifB family Mg chelatase-like AAA ATPase [Corynebacterium phocae]APT92313.1 ATPase [Corynebacterium phocae]KAA8725348.1 YifB family Mg chelatase-like AAA ATPase [Corynebacterium phocae]
MALGKVRTTALDGVLAHPVTVEVNVGAGLPGTQIVGMADTGISEARARIRTAVVNSYLPWPKRKIIVSMAPAALPKSGAHFDLPIALAILLAGLDEQEEDNGGFSPSSEMGALLDTTLFLGELGLDGSIRPVPGVIPALVAARKHGFTRLVIPTGNAAEAALVPHMEVYVASNLQDVFGWVRSTRVLPRATQLVDSAALHKHHNQALPCFSDIAGQSDAKFASEVAAAGGHHMLMLGPPGVGKSMIAARIPGILPELTTQESVEATAIHSIAGNPGKVISRAPFVAPHSSITRASLLGGGSGIARPGAVSLAHHGVLFLDEASEISAASLDGLRAPLEEGQVRLIRSRREVIYPARFQLILAANPCRCGAKTASLCRCKASERQGYLSNISGPLRDRIDMRIVLEGGSSRLSVEGEETSQAIAQRVGQARERALARWRRAGLTYTTNAAVPSPVLRKKFPADDTAMELLRAYLTAGELSQRGVDRALRLSWTLADIAGSQTPGMEEVSRALDLRGAVHGAEVAA